MMMYKQKNLMAVELTADIVDGRFCEQSYFGQA